MEKDFFDEEFEKQERENNENEQRRRQVNDWYNYGPTGGGSAQNVKHRPLWVALVCIALVLALILGWVLCSICTVDTSSNALLNEVISYLDTEYYQEVSDEAMLEAIAAGGTAILQSAGDQYSRLMTPQEYYDFCYSSTTVLSNPLGYFGFSYSNYTIGLYVSEVSVDGSCYGILESGDVIVKIYDIFWIGGPVADDSGAIINSIVVSEWDSDTLTNLMANIYSAKFCYLRDGDLHDTEQIIRGAIGLEKSPFNAASKYDYNYIEFYFEDSDGRIYTNISTTTQNNAKHTTKELRHLDQLPADTGYIRIDQFMYELVYDENGNVKTDSSGNALTITAADEFLEVMRLFKSLGLKQLVLDLKGNPGGSVDAVCNIAGMLITDAKLTETEKSKVTSTEKKYEGQLRITSLIPRDVSETQYEYRTPTYDEYFDSTQEKCNIVVWTDGNSASASELLTGALLDYKTAVQMGTCTYGKGIAQTVIPLTNYTGTVKTNNGYGTFYWAIYYTFAEYYSPLGNAVHGKGYTPEAKYNNLTSYEQLWNATLEYWNVAD